MKRSTLIGLGVLVVLLIVAVAMLRSSPEDDNVDPLIEEEPSGTSNPSIEEQPSLSSDSDVFNEFDSAIDGLS